MEDNDGKVYQSFLDKLKDGSKPAGSVWTSIANVDLLIGIPHLVTSVIRQLPLVAGTPTPSRSVHSIPTNIVGTKLVRWPFSLAV